MARSHDRLEITPKVIDLGASVIQLSHVASAGYGTSHPFRPFGLLSVAAGLGLLGYEFFTRGPSAFVLKGGGAQMLWLAFVALGVGMFLLVFARRLLVIRTSDGRRTTLKAGDDASAAAIVALIRTAMETTGQPVVDSASAPRALPGRTSSVQPTSQPVALGQPAARPQITAQPGSRPIAEPARRAEPQVNGSGARSLNGSSLREPLSAAEAAAIAQRRQLSQPPAQGASAFDRPAYGHAGQIAADAPPSGPFQLPHNQSLQSQPPMPRERLSLPQTIPTTPPPDAAPRDLHILMEHVRGADVQHKEALLELLRVIDEYYQGRASREDAVAHWRSFADYVAQYLGDVDGLLELAERYGQHMVAGR